MDKDKTIVIVGDNSVEGKALFCRLNNGGFTNVIGSSDSKIDLLNQASVEDFFNRVKPKYVFLMHVKSGGILANTSYPAEFIYTNLQAQNNIIHSAYMNKVERLFFLASSCCYPAVCSQPIQEEFLLTDKVEETNESYAIAKIAGIKMVQAYARQYAVNYIVAIPATIYGPGDNFDLENCHVITALIGKFYDAKTNNIDRVTVWGSGQPRREFIYVDDFIDACILLMDNYSSSDVINIGGGYDVSIEELANTIAEVIGFEGEILFDRTKPDGVMQKLLNSDKMKKMGWKYKTNLKKGIELTCGAYKKVAGINKTYSGDRI